MILYDGRLVHLNDCTWCKHRIVYPRKLISKHEVEKCAVSGRLVDRPGKGIRTCEHYQEKGCMCDKCVKPVTTVLQLAIKLDK